MMKRIAWTIVLASGIALSDARCLIRITSRGARAVRRVSWSSSIRKVFRRRRIPFRNCGFHCGVGLAILPPRNNSPAVALDAQQRLDLLEKIRQRFSSRQFVSDISIIPDYYLATARGFAGLAGIQRLQNFDVIALSPMIRSPARTTTSCPWDI